MNKWIQSLIDALYKLFGMILDIDIDEEKTYHEEGKINKYLDCPTWIASNNWGKCTQAKQNVTQTCQTA